MDTYVDTNVWRNILYPSSGLKVESWIDIDVLEKHASPFSALKMETVYNKIFSGY
jgi:hypothetical protein